MSTLNFHTYRLVRPLLPCDEFGDSGYHEHDPGGGELLYLVSESLEHPDLYDSASTERLVAGMQELAPGHS
jgi:hypothetical protein